MFLYKFLLDFFFFSWSIIVFVPLISIYLRSHFLLLLCWCKQCSYPGCLSHIQQPCQNLFSQFLDSVGFSVLDTHLQIITNILFLTFQYLPCTYFWCINVSYNGSARLVLFLTLKGSSPLNVLWAVGFWYELYVRLKKLPSIVLLT